jgi:hypothetical protein
MALNDNSKLNIAFKKLIGKALTDTAKEGYNEANFSGVSVAAQAIPSLELPASPDNSALYNITQSGLSDAVEYVRLPVVLDPSSNGKAYIAQLPAAYESSSSNANAGVAPWVNSQILAQSNAKVQVVPPLYGALYEIKVYSGGTTAMGSGTLIAPGDARDWVFDYFNGILYQQTANASPTLSYIECFVYIGDMVSDSVGGGGGGGSGEVVSFDVNQTTHGFAALDVIYHDGSDWVKAQANNSGTLAQYIVTAVADVDNFTASNWGKVTSTAHGLTVGEHYFLSETTAGGLTATAPTSGYNQPVLYVEDANTLHLLIQRGISTELASGGAVTGTGSAGQIGVWSGTSTQTGDADFTYDDTNKTMTNNGLESIGVNTATALNNQLDATLFTFPKSYKYVVVEYGLVRNGIYRVGRFMITNDDSNVSVSDDYTETAATGFSGVNGVISGSDVVVRYTTTNTGFNATIKYTVRRWS